MSSHITLGHFVGVLSFYQKGAHDDAAVTYAFCRLVDDVVDEAPSEQAALKGFRRLRPSSGAMRFRVHSFVVLVRSCFGMAGHSMLRSS